LILDVSSVVFFAEQPLQKHCYSRNFTNTSWSY